MATKWSVKIMRLVVLIAAVAASIGCAAKRPQRRSQTLLGCFSPTRSAIAWQLGQGAYPSIRGRVIRVDSLAPVAFANVRVGTPSHSTVTKEDGTFELRVDSAGQVAVEVWRIGFERAKSVVEIPRGGAAVLLVALESRNQSIRECEDGPVTTVAPTKP
jgi:hypothetical protein